MKKVIVFAALVLVAFVLVCRYRVYVRDPLATLSRNGVQEEGAQVYINFANDVLIENDNAPRYLELIQHGAHAGVPEKITCVHWMACLLDADQATMLAGSGVRVESMSNQAVRFRDGKGQGNVSLR